MAISGRVDGLTVETDHGIEDLVAYMPLVAMPRAVRPSDGAWLTGWILPLTPMTPMPAPEHADQRPHARWLRSWLPLIIGFILWASVLLLTLAYFLR